MNIHFQYPLATAIFRRDITKNYYWGLNDPARNANILPAGG